MMVEWTMMTKPQSVERQGKGWPPYVLWYQVNVPSVELHFREPKSGAIALINARNGLIESVP